MRVLLLLSTLTLALIPPERAHANLGVGKGPCKTAGDCRSGLCVEVNRDAFCSQTCGDCPAGMYCDAQLFSAVGLEVCVKGRASAPVRPQQPPRLPCRSDAECSGALVCAEMMGHRDCTLPCKQNSTCEAPEMMGMKVDFLACQIDEGDRSRKACLPKRACLSDPSECIELRAGGGSGFGQMAEDAEAWATSMDPTADDDAMEPAEMPPAPAVAPPAEARPAEPRPAAMAPGRFRALLAQLKKTGFDDERMTLLRTAAKRNHFSCAQLGRIIDALAFDDERIEATRIIAPRLVDPENTHTVLDHFDFDDEKAQAAAIFEAL